jgi:hypothetical protein
MTSAEQNEQQQGMKKHAQEALRALIGEHVMCALGEPGSLYRLLVHRLWKDHYRVNVLVGENAAAARIAHSYFVLADSEGNIVKALPAIARQY